MSIIKDLKRLIGEVSGSGVENGDIDLGKFYEDVKKFLHPFLAKQHLGQPGHIIRSRQGKGWLVSLTLPFLDKSSVEDVEGELIQIVEFLSVTFEKGIKKLSKDVVDVFMGVSYSGNSATGIDIELTLKGE